QLSVHAHDVQEPDIAVLDRAALFLRKDVFVEQVVAVLLEAAADRAVAVQLIQQLLHIVKAHRRLSLVLAIVAWTGVSWPFVSSRSVGGAFRGSVSFVRAAAL